MATAPAAPTAAKPVTSRHVPILLPEEIERIRTDTLKLTREDAGMAVGGGLKAFAKYEQGLGVGAASLGRIRPSVGLSNLLRILDIAPALLVFLQGHKLTAADAEAAKAQIDTFVKSRRNRALLAEPHPRRQGGSTTPPTTG